MDMSQTSKDDLGQALGHILGRNKCLLNCTPEWGCGGEDGRAAEGGGRRPLRSIQVHQLVRRVLRSAIHRSHPG